MKFVYQVNREIVRGKHVYRKEDYAFDFLPASIEQLEHLIGSLSVASVSVDELQIEMDVQTGRLLYAWGYCPWFPWKETDMSPGEQIIDGAVFVLGHGLDKGAHRHIPPVNGEWRFIHNRSTGWVSAVGTKDTSADILVRIADGCILGLKGSALSILWIHPETE